MGELLERTNSQLQQDLKHYHHHGDDVNTLEIGSERQSLHTIDELEFLRKELKYTLLKFGITNEEANILLFLMKRGPTKASDIAKGTGISRTDVYYVLKSLQNKGLVIANMAKPVRFVSISLEKMIDFLIHTQKQSLCSMENLKEQVKDIWSKIRESEVIKETSEIKPPNYQMLAGFDRVFSKARVLISLANREVIVIANEKNMARLFHQRVTDELLVKTNNGIDVQILTSCLHDGELVTELSGCTIKEMPESFNHEMFLIIIDNEQLLLIENNNERFHDTFALWTDNRMLIDAFQLLFGQGCNNRERRVSK